MAPVAILLALLAGAPAAAGEAAPSPAPVRQAPAAPRPADDARFVVRQSLPFSCGAAALASLLRLETGEPWSEADVLHGLMEGVAMAAVRRAGGFSLAELEAFLERIGLAGLGEEGLGIADLAVRLPAIVPIDVAGDRSHFVVVAAMRGTDLVLLDPAAGRRTMGAAAFRAVWHGIAYRLAGA